MTKKNSTTNVLTLDTHNFTDRDLHTLAVSLADMVNSRAMSDDGGEDAMGFLNQIEDELFRRKSCSPQDALRKLLHLATDEIKSNFSFGPDLVADAERVLMEAAQ